MSPAGRLSAALALSRAWAVGPAGSWGAASRAAGLVGRDAPPRWGWTLVNAPFIACVLVYQLLLRPRTASWDCCYVPGCSDFAVGCLRRGSALAALRLVRARMGRCNGSGFGLDTPEESVRLEDREAFDAWLAALTPAPAAWRGR